MSLIPLLPFTLCFIIGVLLQGWGVGAIFLALPIGIAGCAILLKRSYPAILSLAVATGYLVAMADMPAPLSDRFSISELEFSGVVEDETEYDSGRSMLVRVDSCSGMPCTPFQAKAFVPSVIPAIMETDRIRFITRMQPLLKQPGLPDEVDYDASLRRRGVVGNCFIEPDRIAVTGEAQGLLPSLRRFSDRMVVLIGSSSLSGFSKELLSAMLTGDRSLLSLSLKERFAKTGLSHILALSGLHVGVLCSILSVMLFPLWMLRLKWLRILLILTLLWLFAAFTGLSPSVVRSVIMASIYFISLKVERVRSPFNSLCLAALLILVFAPSSLYEIGFQMSFVAVGAILLFGEKFNPVDRRHKWAYLLLAYPAVTLAATISTGILSAWYFNTFPLYFIPANFVAALLLPVFLTLGVLYVAMLLLGLHLDFIGEAIDAISGIVVSWADFVGSLPMSTLSELNVTPLMLIFWFAAFVSLALALYRRRIVYMLATILLFAATLVVPILSPQANTGELYIVKAYHHTALLLNDGVHFGIFSTAPQYQHQHIAEELNERYRKYRLRRGLSPLISINGNRKFSHHNPSDNEIIAGRLRFIFVKDSIPAVNAMAEVNTTYAVVCSGYRGEIEDIITRLRPDTVILSGDLDKRRHNRYLDRLNSLSTPTKTLRDTIFHTTF